MISRLGACRAHGKIIFRLVQKIWIFFASWFSVCGNYWRRKYLRCFLNHRFWENSDVSRILCSFRKSVGKSLINFASVQITVKLNLFRSILCFPKYFSNHYTCNMSKMLVLKNLMIFRQFKFYVWLKYSRSMCFLRPWFKFTSFSRFCQNVRSILRDNYDLIDILRNAQNTICARIELFQKREPSSFHMCLS